VKKAGSIFTTLVFGFILYLILFNSVSREALVVGFVAALISSFVLARYVDLPVKYLSPVRILWLAAYLPYFLFEMVKSNIQIALIVLDPRLPIKPEIKTGRTSLKSPYGRLLLTSSITLTPGTLSVDLNGDELQIHCVSNPGSAEEIMAPFEKFIRRITE
jgi:multicomponent Na+:H+ antiporter subunit E